MSARRGHGGLQSGKQTKPGAVTAEPPRAACLAVAHLGIQVDSPPAWPRHGAPGIWRWGGRKAWRARCAGPASHRSSRHRHRGTEHGAVYWPAAGVGTGAHISAMLSTSRRHRPLPEMGYTGSDVGVDGGAGWCSSGKVEGMNFWPPAGVDVHQQHHVQLVPLLRSSTLQRGGGLSTRPGLCKPWSRMSCNVRIWPWRLVSG